MNVPQAFWIFTGGALLGVIWTFIALWPNPLPSGVTALVWLIAIVGATLWLCVLVISIIETFTKE